MINNKDQSQNTHTQKKTLCFKLFYHDVVAINPAWLVKVFLTLWSKSFQTCKKRLRSTNANSYDPDVQLFIVVF